ncbi:MAG: site-specific integrase [Bacteroidota bacterium]
MEANTSFSILFYPRTGDIDKNGLAPIFVRITVNGNRAEISIKRKINPEDWQPIPNTGNIKSLNKQFKELNIYLDKIKVKLYDIQSGFISEGRAYTALMIKNKFLNRDKPVKTVFQIYDEHNNQIKELVGTDYSKGAYLRHVRTRNYLAAFLKKEYKLKDFFVQDIDLNFINHFYHYLKINEIGNSNTITKYVTNFKKIMRIAFANNWVSKDPFYNWKAQWKKVDREVLSELEIKALMDKAFSRKRLEQVRDIFVFCCFTGLAYVDVQKLSSHHIVLGSDGERWIKIKRSKTDSRSTIPLLPSAEKILAKYDNEVEKSEDGLVLPVISNQKTNAFLKEIAVVCHIKKNLTFHLARHTFATTVTLANGIPIESVSKMLGHQSLRTTQIYAKVIDQKLKKDMDKIKDKYSFPEALNG